MIPQDLKYTKEHEWVRVEDGEAVVGITEYAQSELGDITFVELPEKGKRIEQSENMATVESVKAASEVYSPVSGEVIEVNEALTDAPGEMNRSSYDKGWICRLRVDDAGGIESLMDAAAYENYLKELKQ
ncbi:MAG: glycine cleavage system protein GcvH [Candidatus Omnitrophica bacterium]|nr:glycine cleavage system protein GcvH [Candidatus Omnitrophota bacterium]